MLSRPGTKAEEIKVRILGSAREAVGSTAKSARVVAGSEYIPSILAMMAAAVLSYWQVRRPGARRRPSRTW